METGGQNVLVIGSGGFVGACIMEGLQKAGANVSIFSEGGDIYNFVKENLIEKIYFVHYQWEESVYTEDEIAEIPVINIYTVREIAGSGIDD